MRSRTLRGVGACALVVSTSAPLGACHNTTGAVARSAAHSPVHSTPEPTSPSPHRARRPTPQPTPAVRRVSARFLGASWHRGCPVPPSELRAVRLHYWGFDGRDHVGTIVVNASAVRPIRQVFDVLRRERFPVRRIRP
ncbi:MAG: M15 family peptidase, partial [Catenulispora sp.]